MSIHKLYGELAASLVRATTDGWAPGAAPARAGVTLDGWCQSAFEDACGMLAKLGLATDEHGKVIYHWSTEMKLAIDANRVAQVVANRSRAGQIIAILDRVLSLPIVRVMASRRRARRLPPIDDVIGAWVWCADHKGHASLKRVPFVPHDDIMPVTDGLAALGYAKPLGSAFIWTDKIGPAMRASGAWNENNLSYAELEEREVDLDMRNALASIPEDVRQAALTDNVIAVVQAVAARWIDGVWLPDR
jgi:hypothetical protein